MLQNAQNLEVFEGLEIVFTTNPEHRELLISLNAGEGTQYGQLWNGINAEGKLLDSIGGEYSNLTKELKSQEGFPIDRVTLYDTGEFYESFRVEVKANELLITANTNKDGEDLQNRWGSELLGLTEDNTRRLADALIEDLREWLLNELLK